MPAEAALVTYLDTLLTETGGTDLFEGQMPELPANCIAVAHYDSLEAEDRIMSASLVDQQCVWPVMVQVMARNTDKATAESRARAAFDVLDNFAGTLSGVLYHSIECEEPFNMGQDKNERWRFAFNCQVRKARG